MGIIISSGIDIIRVWFGPLNYDLCTFNSFLKIFTFIAVCITYTVLTVIKFVFLCVLKRIPEMDDDFVSMIIIRSVVFSSLIVSGSTVSTYKINMGHVRFSKFPTWPLYSYLQFFSCSLSRQFAEVILIIIGII